MDQSVGQLSMKPRVGAWNFTIGITKVSVVVIIIRNSSSSMDL